ncbi:undecaprenyl-diphosphate phosphatase [Chromohalobacter sp. TMW 2.2308]|uniref:Undecaprenyl-diphosphatase n=1 Tax=Chromohalobacter moromii TaxID=2860329 RepID=A0A9X2X0I9_9GAMM|nr:MULTISPECIES: undecaprenyl-diphosphate phosphatase [Chromohalobacter]CDQ33626.1 Undecaprenyl-diphosphatase [Virgibacillus halodenitrificans]MCK2041409.1 undecaprenyl-diphosphate phosphatase [Chromohalobacter moromii]MCK2044350.1 undecaprenyl-diphosphate phosphatase [Chromohalobacter moromii]MCT8504490.1 undecaprenyl-diphosphate phosphatase [Chromohalobacter moromii]MCT8513557.1 undecaprenyl-diphosphate phosphatase [Chromohalobacter sp. TMW 2.2271]
MDWLHVVALAIIQGLTEFLPISSSAHLILPSQLLGWPDQGLAFDVAVHVGSLAAVMLVFHREVTRIVRDWVAQCRGAPATPESRLGWAVIIGTLPAVIIGFLLESVIESYLRASLVIAITTLVFGLLLWWADVRGSRRHALTAMSLRNALIIGLAQALALIPGTSRSGITITAALLLGFTRQAAARFSFLLSIPLILAAGSLKGIELVEAGEGVAWGTIVAGTLMSFVAAWLCIKLFLAALDRIGMLPFVIYRLILGVVLLVWVT